MGLGSFRQADKDQVRSFRQTDKDQIKKIELFRLSNENWNQIRILFLRGFLGNKFPIFALIA